MDATAQPQTLGVIDIGSNSGRVLVARVDSVAHLEVLGDARSPLRLVRDVARRGELTEETISRTLRIVRGFAAVATGAGAQRTVAVATAAVREASNGLKLIDRVRTEIAVEVEIADGQEEAHFGFLGAVHGLPIQHGIVLDIGGGSLQLIHFRDRRLTRSWSLKLGALRLSDRFLRSDPSTRGEMRSLKGHVYEQLEAAGVTSLGSDECLIGTGGTVRNLAKVDRRMLGEYPISRLHGYEIDRHRLDEVGRMLAALTGSERARVPGLNTDRADSIVGGVLAAQSVMDRLLATRLSVAGYGLREGIALRSVTDQPASVPDVQRAAVSALGRHFGSWDERRAERRALLVDRLLQLLLPNLPPEARSAAALAARLLEVGASIDYYRRHEHSARIIADANIDGYSHRTLALASAAVLAVGEREASIKSFGRLLRIGDVQLLEQIAAAIGLTDAMVRYGTEDVARTSPERSNGYVALAIALVDAWPLEAPTRRAERAFGVPFVLREPSHAS